ncbi:cadherin-related family member 5 [Eublepharis macularius]|uniref:Cadherin-related family member 5 n=1 Tax=Eublepharis macularius TaxID=481883 RepID=A0AA97IYZ9_EUBMA|nr:cadherin-related family member 5 [Eublepharis macularius]
MALFRQSCTCMVFLMVTAIHVQAQISDCSIRNDNPHIEENNLPGHVVITIEKGPGVTITIDPETEHPEYFEINGTQLILNHSLDYETTSAIYVRLKCWDNGAVINTLDITVSVINMNDNPPVFKEANITVNVDEDIKVNTIVVPQANVTATDADTDTVFYNLTGNPLEATDYFNIQGVNNPGIYLRKALDYEKMNFMQLTLYAMDGRAGALGVHTATATITIHILQADLRPPWFQPCIFIADSKVCISRGYTGRVNISEIMTGPLILKPGPLYAVDGDVSLNEKTEYRIVDGNDNDTFSINKDTGNITMNKPVNTLRTFVLYVMASQVNNSLRFSQTTVEIQVVRRNDHKPNFEKAAYLGTVSVNLPISSLVMDAGISSRPLQIFAADEDFPDKVNPDISYQIQNSTDFTVSQDGFLLTTVVLNSAATITFLAIAYDKTTLEEASTLITVDVTPLASTTTVPTTTTTTAAPNTPETRTTVANPSSSSLTSGINNTRSTTRSGSSAIPPESTTRNAGFTGRPVTNTASVSIISPLVTTITPPIITVNTSQSQTTRSPITGISQASRTSTAGITGRPATVSGSIIPPLVTTIKPPIITVNTSQSQTTSFLVTRKSQATVDSFQSTSQSMTAITTTDVISLSTARITSLFESIKPLTTTRGAVHSSAHSSAAVKTTQTTSMTSRSTTRNITSATTASSASAQISTDNRSTGSMFSPKTPTIDTATVECYCEEKDMVILGATLGSLLAITLVLLGLISCKYYTTTMKQKDGEDSEQLSLGSTNHSFQDDEKPELGEKDNKSLVSDESENNDPVTKVRSGTPPPLQKAMESSQASSGSEGIGEDEDEEDDDSEKEVKSILTKDRRLADDGYKAVWFKEDINPEAKDDVVIIEADSDAEQNRNDNDSDNGDDEGEGDDRDSGRGGIDVSFVPGVLSEDDPTGHLFHTVC